MSDDAKKGGGVGYGSPPADHQFKPGKSGNPRGRPVKLERSFTPRQVTRDVLDITEASTKIRTADGVQSIAIIEAILRKAVQKALEGHAPSQRLILGLHGRAVADHFKRYQKQFAFIEMVEDDQVVKPAPPQNERGYLKFINDLRRRTRRK